MHHDLGICFGGMRWDASVSFPSSPDPQGLAALGWESGKVWCCCAGCFSSGLINT
jgi:hypothetical protein